MVEYYERIIFSIERVEPTSFINKGSQQNKRLARRESA
jgi:hypothetical protein